MVLYVLSCLAVQVPSMSQNTSSRTLRTENPGVYRGGAASFGNANFTGGGHTFGSNSTVNNYGPDANELKKHQLITTLPRVNAGRKDKTQSGPCFQGTRQALLQEMADWATDPDESGMYVLSGLAGIGNPPLPTLLQIGRPSAISWAPSFFSHGVTQTAEAPSSFSQRSLTPSVVSIKTSSEPSEKRWLQTQEPKVRRSNSMPLFWVH